LPQKTRVLAVAAALSVAGSLGATATAGAKLRMPFKCGVKVYGEARANHAPSAAIDFNGTGGGDTDLGMPVVAAGPGVITVSQYYTSNGYGNAIEIRHPSGARTFYAHLKSRRFGVGRKVRQGQRIGRLGKSSAKYTFTAHLHYEQRNAAGTPVRARFNGRLAAPYRNMETPVLMRSFNGC
jgi:murein DD-endopeptidase MepM/ murein hydrolase activator NlpD